MYLTVKMGGSETLITKEIDAEDLEDNKQQIADIRTFVDEGNLVILTDSIDTLRDFFPEAVIRNCK